VLSSPDPAKIPEHKKTHVETDPSISPVQLVPPGGAAQPSRAVPMKSHGRISLATVLIPCCLLILPITALYRRGADLRWVAAYLFGIGVLTYWQYAADKKKARGGAWRISETRLHFLELVGGWPGAWMAQRRLRHKCSKTSYQIIFWLIVFFWQLIACGALRMASQ